MAIILAPVVNFQLKLQIWLFCIFNLSSSSIGLDYFHKNSERNISIIIRDAHYRIIRYSRIILEYLFSNPEFRILF